MVTLRSALATVVLAVAELLAALLSLGELTVAVFEIVVGLDGDVTVRVMLGAAPGARAARVQVTGGTFEQDQPVP